jgi:hypothetical protein
MEPQFERYIDWYLARQVSGPTSLSSTTFREIVSEYIQTRDGRQRLAQSMLNPSRIRIQSHHQNGLRVRPLRRHILEIENFLAILPDGERFTIPVEELRNILVELIALLDVASNRPRSESLPSDPEVEGYEGPRPTRFERIFMDEE